jgi:hypothetical protein
MVERGRSKGTRIVAEDIVMEERVRREDKQGVT